MRIMIVIVSILAVAYLDNAPAQTLQAEEMEMKNLTVDLGFVRVPDEHTYAGRDVSPRIEVKGLDAASMAIILDDQDAPRGVFTHWIIWNIPPIEALPQGVPRDGTVTRPIQAVQGRNSFGKIGYYGPCPPPGKPHRYFFRIYGLDKMLDLKAGASRSDLERAMTGHVLQQGEAMATYGR
jgi:Raf kinase inhibitor-like YbhB/YbcL family protein